MFLYAWFPMDARHPSQASLCHSAAVFHTGSRCQNVLQIHKWHCFPELKINSREAETFPFKYKRNIFQICDSFLSIPVFFLEYHLMLLLLIIYACSDSSTENAFGCPSKPFFQDHSETTDHRINHELHVLSFDSTQIVT